MGLRPGRARATARPAGAVGESGGGQHHCAANILLTGAQIAALAFLVSKFAKYIFYGYEHLCLDVLAAQ